MRFICDENCRIEREGDDSMIVNIKIRFCNFEVYFVYCFKIVLFCGNEFILVSEVDVLYFVEKVLVFGEEILRVYVDFLKGISEDGMILLLVVNVVEEICEGFFGRRILLIFYMLRCFLGDIWFYLDSLGV